MTRLTRGTLPIAVFDSGVGGLTVLHECLVSLPHEDWLYLGDTARFPYGTRSRKELAAFARELAGVLLDRGAKLLVVACNSATAAALPALREELEERVAVVTVVGPEARQAARASRSGRVGLVATPATVASGTYERELSKATDGRSELVSVAAPELASLIQAGGEVDERTVQSRGGGLCPAARGQRGHGDPRLHPLSARAPAVPAHAGAGRGGDHLGRGDRRRGAQPAEGRPPRGAARPARQLPLPLLRRPGGVPPAGHPLPAAADQRG